MKPRKPARRHQPQPTTTEKGYGSAHQKVRERVKRTVDCGQAVCWRCGRWIRPGSPWDLGHDDTPTAKVFGIYRGPEHQRCSRSAGGVKRWGIRAPAQPTPQTPAPALRFFDIGR